MNSADQLPKKEGEGPEEQGTIFPTVSIDEDQDREEVEGLFKKRMYKIVIGYSKTETVTIIRRFRDFEWLHAWLKKQYPQCVVPRLPEKNPISMTSYIWKEFLATRKLLLEFFVWKILSHKKLSGSEHFKLFKTQNSSSFESIKAQNPAPSNVSLIGELSYTDQFITKASTAISYLGSFVSQYP
jgi:PX domain